MVKYKKVSKYYDHHLQLFILLFVFKIATLNVKNSQILVENLSREPFYTNSLALELLLKTMINASKLQKLSKGSNLKRFEASYKQKTIPRDNRG